MFSGNASRNVFFTSVTPDSTVTSAVVVALMRAFRAEPGLFATMRCKCRAAYFSSSLKLISLSLKGLMKNFLRSIIECGCVEFSVGEESGGGGESQRNPGMSQVRPGVSQRAMSSLMVVWKTKVHGPNLGPNHRENARESEPMTARVKPIF